jgi:hypothetical protein
MLDHESQNNGLYYRCPHIKCVPFHHDMARPQFADGREDPQIWRGADNILNMQLWTRGGPLASLGLLSYVFT